MPCERCKEVDKDSYAVVVDSIRRTDGDLSPHEVRVRAAKRFRPVYRAMREASEIENEGNAEYENGKFLLNRDGEMFFPSINTTADQLHKNQRKISEMSNDPSKYSASDHQRTQLIQLAFANGATIVRTSFIREDETNRDIIEYRLDRATNMGVIRIVNTAVTGTQHSAEKIKEITRKKSEQLHEVSPLEKVFIFTDVKIEQEKIQSVIRVVDSIKSIPGVGVEYNFKSRQSIQNVKQEYADAKSFIKNPSKSRTSDLVYSVGSKVIHDGTKATAAMSDYFIRKYIQKRKEMKAYEYGSKDRGLRAKKNFLGLREYGNKLKKISEYREIFVEIYRKFKEFKMAKKIVQFGQFGVGIGAGVYTLNILARELPRSLKSLEKKRIRFLRRKETVRKKSVLHGMKEIHQSKMSRLKTVHKEPKSRIRMKKDMYVLQAKSVTRHEKKQFRLKENKRIKTRESSHRLRKKERVVLSERTTRSKKEKQLKFVIRLILRRLQKEKRMEIRQLSEKKIKSGKFHKEMKKIKTEERVFRTAESKKKELKIQKKKEKKAVLNFTFAFTLWMLFLYDSKLLHLEKPSDTKKTIENHEENKTDQKSETEEIRPWILFSIIYYLSMIRESGARHSPQQKAVSKKKSKKFHRIMPQSGIIFAFPS